jgi:ribosomal protein L11 methylase PrmA
VLSGILPSQANAVIAAYRPLALTRRLDLDRWTTLVFTRRTPRRRVIAPRRSAS